MWEFTKNVFVNAKADFLFSLLVYIFKSSFITRKFKAEIFYSHFVFLTDKGFAVYFFS